ncbi:MAG TPA: transcriptional repressor [Deltaproteobacteria bacterium]|nr:transcriptional repressor [Deltaproteobacteria bacterium]
MCIDMHQDMVKPSCVRCTEQGFCSDKLSELLHCRGGRLTKERLFLLKSACDMNGHFQAHHLYSLLNEHGYPVSLTTVYRNLALLTEAGIIRRAFVQDDTHAGGVWYEHIWGHEHHDHLVCSSCGMKVEFSYPAIDILQEAVAKEHGFSLTHHHLELIGLCPECTHSRTEDA